MYYIIIAYLLLSFIVGMILVNKNDSLLSIVEIVLLFGMMLFSPISIIWMSIKKFKLTEVEEFGDDNY